MESETERRGEIETETERRREMESETERRGEIERDTGVGTESLSIRSKANAGKGEIMCARAISCAFMGFCVRVWTV